MLKDLIDYLNKEIYPNMSAKKVKEIKSQSLGGGLMDIIEKYANFKIQKALDIQSEQNKLDVQSYKNIINELRGDKGEKKVYREKRIGNATGAKYTGD